MPGLVALWNVEMGWMGGEVGSSIQGLPFTKGLKLDFRCYLQMRLRIEPLSTVFEVLMR